MAQPSWQEQLRLRLAERNIKESSHATIIEQYRKLAQQTVLWKVRNTTLLRAVGTSRGGNASNSAATAGATEDDSVRDAYMASLESQISSLRDELAAIYKSHGQNIQRLLSMNETLREHEELARKDSENLRRSRDEIATLKYKVDQHAELMAEKNRTIQILHDEIDTLQLELGQIEERNQTLMKDNAKLLQRWLDAKQMEVNDMNKENEVYENMRSQQVVRDWQDSSDNGLHGQNIRPNDIKLMSGKGEARERDGQETKMQDLPAAARTTELTPNGLTVYHE